MKQFLVILSGFITVLSISACNSNSGNSFWKEGEEIFEVQEVFFNERFPNVVVTTAGTVLATWGNDNYRVRRSTDGGAGWGPEITVAKPGFQGGGSTVDENTGDILLFVEESHPVAPLTLFRSTDDGRSWSPQEVSVAPNSLGHVPSMHMNEHGITLSKGKYAGRLIRPTRYYGAGNDHAFWDDHYTNAIFSDDGGVSWQASEPFPANGTGEASLAELSDGSIYYNTRRHKSTDGLNPRMRHIARSYDGGQTWEGLELSEILPDGDQCRDYGLMGGLVRLPLKDHDILLFSNIESEEGRTHGTVWASFDGGLTWPVKRLVEEGSFAYSSMCAGRDGTPSEGMIYLFYESEGGGKMARFNLTWLLQGQNWEEFLPGD